MNIAVLGGSFNPPHVGHVFICHYVLATADVEQVWVIPCYHHAFEKPLAAFQHRVTMCGLAVEAFRPECVRVSSVEQERRGVSWTIDTVRYLQARYPEHTFTWIIGSDVLAELDKWKDVDQLRRLIAFIVVPRAGFAQEVKALPEARRLGYASHLQEAQLPNISSTLIRERVKQQHAITHLVPHKIAEYIRIHKLYQE